jgi:hypothetical protein
MSINALIIMVTLDRMQLTYGRVKPQRRLGLGRRRQGVSGICDVTVMALMASVCWPGAYIQDIQLFVFYYAHSSPKSPGLQERTLESFSRKSQAH